MPSTLTTPRPPDPARTTPGRHWTANGDVRARLTRLDDRHLDAVTTRLITQAARMHADLNTAQRTFGPPLGAHLAEAGFGDAVTGLANTCLSPGRFLGALRLNHGGLPVTLLLAEAGRDARLLGYDIPQAAPPARPRRRQFRTLI